MIHLAFGMLATVVLQFQSGIHLAIGGTILKINFQLGNFEVPSPIHTFNSFWNGELEPLKVDIDRASKAPRDNTLSGAATCRRCRYAHRTSCDKPIRE